MRHFLALVVSATTAVFSLVGCGSDSDGGPANMSTQCVGNNAEFTKDELVALTESDKACSSMSDMSTVCANDMPKIGGQCGKSCLGMSDEATCVGGCIQSALAPNTGPLSVACLTCYGQDIACAKMNCLATCGLGPTSQECLTCRTDNGCVAAFYECSGLPEPTGT